MKELSIGDPELLRWVQAWTGCGLEHASSLLTIIKRYLDGEVSKEQIANLRRNKCQLQKNKLGD